MPNPQLIAEVDMLARRQRLCEYIHWVFESGDGEEFDHSHIDLISGVVKVCVYAFHPVVAHFILGECYE